ncbi:MAG: membrane dipeptidase [Oscillospiraceae bacterium]|nr:membrane dipeptidase [Oscillospiraceae bacterium]
MKTHSSRPPLFDGHCDTLLWLKGDLVSNGLHVDLTRADYAPYAQFFAIYHPFKPMFDELYAKLTSELETAGGAVRLCRTAGEAEKAAEAGAAAAFVSVEGAHVFGCDAERLPELKEKGVSAVCLTWNTPTVISGTNVNEPERGLSAEGRAFVRRMNELGMIVDVSHLSDPGFWDVAEICEGPIIASHSNARALCGHTRNLTDEMFRAIVEKGGVAGLNLYSAFLVEPGKTATVEDAVHHIEHFLELGGGKNIAIGGDLDGCDTLPTGIAGIQNVGKIFDALLARGCPESTARDIFYNNLMRVVKQVCGT